MAGSEGETSATFKPSWLKMLRSMKEVEGHFASPSTVLLLQRSPAFSDLIVLSQVVASHSRSLHLSAMSSDTVSSMILTRQCFPQVQALQTNSLEYRTSMDKHFGY